MAQIHRIPLVIDDTTFQLVRCGTNENGVSIRKMFEIVKSQVVSTHLFFPTKHEYTVLLSQLKHFPDSWKGFVSTIAFRPFSAAHYESIKYIKWYGKGRGRRWREAEGSVTDVLVHPGCIICAKRVV